MRPFAIFLPCFIFVSCGHLISVGDRLDFGPLESGLWQYSDSGKCLVVYSETGMCAECWAKQFVFWQLRINGIQQAESRMTVAFVLAPSRKDDIEIIQNITIENAAIMIDSTRYFRRNNHLHRNGENNCFVVDRSNKVLYMGNPLFSMDQWNEILSL